MNGTYSVGMSVNANLRCYNFSEKARSHSTRNFFVNALLIHFLKLVLMFATR
ncbi:hypothetical protein LEP1GSC068_1667 [Leptospira sp. Fiocruz LV3954]|uniref:hypothetical protein n=1 Tax=Leptospira santarosai TaxID=28183 RepID=UPI00029279FC|nr:hypothetical protein [Leptospira santarosai]EKO76969.1 hypothetical protein LEP1GSC068_1667 [Leptospira sp. Fiocruz LV3954]EMI67227.1 hypothetical protein LEP1GSC076_1392 [Leptospira sp. Fiocruz LV4135]